MHHLPTHSNRTWLVRNSTSFFGSIGKQCNYSDEEKVLCCRRRRPPQEQVEQDKIRQTRRKFKSITSTEPVCVTNEKNERELQQWQTNVRADDLRGSRKGERNFQRKASGDERKCKINEIIIKNVNQTRTQTCHERNLPNVCGGRTEMEWRRRRNRKKWMNEVAKEWNKWEDTRTPQTEETERMAVRSRPRELGWREKRRELIVVRNRTRRRKCFIYISLRHIYFGVSFFFVRPV